MVLTGRKTLYKYECIPVLEEKRKICRKVDWNMAVVGAWWMKVTDWKKNRDVAVFIFFVFLPPIFKTHSYDRSRNFRKGTIHNCRKAQR